MLSVSHRPTLVWSYWVACSEEGHARPCAMVHCASQRMAFGVNSLLPQWTPGTKLQACVVSLLANR